MTTMIGRRLEILTLWYVCKFDMVGDTIPTYSWSYFGPRKNDLSEKEQRWGSKAIEGSGRKDALKLDSLRDAVTDDHQKSRSPA